MANGQNEAISVMEYYAGLADGIFHNCEKYLAKDVVLDWFGRIIKGRSKVVRFLEYDQIRTLHVFSSIAPISSITAGNKRRFKKGRKKLKLSSMTDVQETNNETDTADQSNVVKTDEIAWEFTKKRSVMRRRYNKAIKRLDEVKVVHHTMVNKTFETDEGETNSDKNLSLRRRYGKAVKDLDKVKIIHHTMVDKSEISETDEWETNSEDNSDDFFMPSKITWLDDVENQQNINGLELKEEMASTITAITTECGQGDESGRVETGTIQYAEANGRVRFTRNNIPKDPWSYRFFYPVQCWKRKCTLQIAYSYCVDNNSPEVIPTSKDVPSNAEDSKALNEKLFEDPLRRRAMKCMPDEDYFGGYSMPVSYATVRDIFLKDFEAFIVARRPDLRLPKLRFEGDKRIFEFNKDRENYKGRTPNNNIFQFHKITYKRLEDK